MQFATVEQTHALAAAVEAPYRAFVLTAAFGGLRYGELAELRRRRVDLLHRTLTVAEQLTEVNGHLAFTSPKTAVGRRTIALPAFVADALEIHFTRYAEPGRDGLVFHAPTADHCAAATSGDGSGSPHSPLSASKVGSAVGLVDS